MKTIYVLFVATGILSVALYTSSCERRNARIDSPKVTYSDHNYSIVELDGCEYVTSDVHHGKSITHKGNCKFCAKRKDQNPAPCE